MTDSSSTSPETIAIPAGLRAAGELVVPPSKSVTNRLCNLALVAWQPVTLVRPLRADDTARFFAVLRRLGFRVEEGPEEVALTPPPAPPARARFDCGESGTLLRLLIAALATLEGVYEVDGAPRLRERPVGPLVAALAALGVRIDYLGTPGYPPLRIAGGTLAGGRVSVDAGSSSQFLSALLMAATRAAAPVEIEVPALVSGPYVELTLDLLARQGGRIERLAADRYAVTPGPLAGGRLEVEGDYSAAAYPAAAAALTGGRVRLHGLRRDSRQGDRELLDLLARMGAGVRWGEGWVEVSGGELRGLAADAGQIPDQVPTLAALAPFCSGESRFTGAAHLRLKESDRIAAMASELRRAGAEATELPDGIAVTGRWAESAPPETPVEIATWGDHRIAMAMALVGLRRPGLRIANPGVVAKSYPGFWDDLGRLIGRPLRGR